MAFDTIIPAIDCIPVCDTQRVMSDAQFFAYVIDKLNSVTEDVFFTITSADLQAATDEALCDLQDRTAFSSASPETLRAIVVYLVSLL